MGGKTPKAVMCHGPTLTTSFSEHIDLGISDPLYLAAVMHLKRKPGYWVSRGKAK
jgi:hypothetical protein